jgi:transposase
MPLPEQAANEMWDRLADTMVREGEMTPDAGYAMKKPGLLVTPHIEHLLPECQRRQWEAALVEYQNALASRRS